MRRDLDRRLAKLEAAAAEQQDQPERFSPREWLEAFGSPEVRAFCAGEPDYQAALDAFDAEVRDGARLFSQSSWFWLWEMIQRRRRGIPPLTEQEWAELRTWFLGTYDDLRRSSLPCLVDETPYGRAAVPPAIAGYNLDLADVRDWFLNKSARQRGAGRVAAAVRFLRAEWQRFTSPSPSCP